MHDAWRARRTRAVLIFLVSECLIYNIEVVLIALYIIGLSTSHKTYASVAVAVLAAEVELQTVAYHDLMASTRSLEYP